MEVKVAVAFPFGSLIRLTAAFTDPLTVDPVTLEEAPIDPTTITVKIKKPDATVVTKVYGTDIDVILDSVGHYHIDIDADAAGPWVFGWFGTGTGQAANEHGFKVLPTAFP